MKRADLIRIFILLCLGFIVATILVTCGGGDNPEDIPALEKPIDSNGHKSNDGGILRLRPEKGELINQCFDASGVLKCQPLRISVTFVRPLSDSVVFRGDSCSRWLQVSTKKDNFSECIPLTMIFSEDNQIFVFDSISDGNPGVYKVKILKKLTGDQFGWYILDSDFISEFTIY